MVGSANGMSMSTSRTRLPKNWSRTSTQAISVPITTFTTVTMSAWPTVSRIAAAVCSFVTVSQNAVHPPWLAVIDHGGQRDQHEQAEPDHRHPEAEARRLAEGGRRGADRRRGAGRLAGDDSCGHSPLPDSAMITVTMPVSSSKNLSDSSDQLPKSSSTVSRFVTVGERIGRIVGALDLAVVDALDDRAEALERELLLAVLAEHEVEPVLRLRVGVDEDGARVLDEHRGLGDDVVELLAVLVGEDRLVLVGHAARRRCRRGRRWWRHGRCWAATRRWRRTW